MITREGYSYDPSIRPEAIVVTFGKEMISDKGGLLRFVRWFEDIMFDDEGLWMHKCRNRAKFDDLQYVYVSILNRIHYRCLYGGYQTEAEGHLTPDGPLVKVQWGHIVLAGPLLKAPYKIIRPGFQGFRYATKLF